MDPAEQVFVPWIYKGSGWVTNPQEEFPIESDLVQNEVIVEEDFMDKRMRQHLRR